MLTSEDPLEDKKKFPPHIWALAAMAYRNMKVSKQAIVISGESGSGKTENAKRCMKFLTGLGGTKQHDPSSQT
jgi:myosin heavy subunit